MNGANSYKLRCDPDSFIESRAIGETGAGKPAGGRLVGQYFDREKPIAGDSEVRHNSQSIEG
jgi:hypothetical protein